MQFKKSKHEVILEQGFMDTVDAYQHYDRMGYERALQILSRRLCQRVCSNKTLAATDTSGCSLLTRVGRFTASIR